MDGVKYTPSEWFQKVEWIEHPLTTLVTLMMNKKKDQKIDTVVLDIDSTLVCVTDRSRNAALKALADLGERYSLSEKLLPLKEQWSSRQRHEWPYHINTLLDQTIESEDIRSHFVDLWKDFFFCNKALEHDVLYDKASDFVQSLYAMEFNVIFLTGRDEPRQGEGTLKQLKQHDLWNDQQSRLILKPHGAMDDYSYKMNAYQTIAQDSNINIVATFENEPLNLAGMSMITPQALCVLHHTSHSMRPIPHISQLYRIRSFE